MCVCVCVCVCVCELVLLSHGTQLSARVLPLFTTKQLSVVVDSCFSIEESTEAHKRMKENKNIGKIVMNISK